MASVWILFLFIAVIFLLLTAGLTIYHTFLILTNQTTWEHSRREAISYLKPYGQSTLLPFYVSVKENVSSVFCHGNVVQDWKLRQPREIY